MLTRLALVVAASIGLLFGQTAGASPIAYDFTGILDAPFNGTNQFSGSFTINGDPTVSGYPGSVTENGSDVSLAVNTGGQTFNFVNQLNPNIVASFTVGPSPTRVNDPQSPPQNEFFIYGAKESGNPTVSFGMSFYSPLVFGQLSNLREFPFNLGTGSVYMNFDLGAADGFTSGGSITSIDLVPNAIPEPSALVIFAALGVAAMARCARRS